MVSVLFVSLLIRIAGLFFQKQQEENALQKLKMTTQKVGQATKTGFNQAVDVNEMYKKANQIMQKDSLTQEDYAYMKMVDSTFKSMTK